MHTINDLKCDFALYFREHAFFRQNNLTTKRSKRKQRTQQTHAIRTADGMATTTRLEQQNRFKRDTAKYPASIIFEFRNEFSVWKYIDF